MSETWKGEAPAQLVVPFEGFMVCPAPPRFVTGERVLAFLAPGQRGDGEALSVLGLSYGTLYPHDEELADFRDTVAAAVRLQQQRHVSRRERLQWTVEAAARPGTRWHGLFDLHPAGDAVHSYYDGESRPLARHRLSSEQLELLARSFVDAPSTDQTAVMMLGVLAGWPSEAVDRTAVAVVEALLQQPEPAWWLTDLLAVTLGRFGDQQVEQRLQPLGAFGDYPIEAARTLWQRARGQLAIPEVPPAQLRLPVVWGVGERTPS